MMHEKTISDPENSFDEEAAIEAQILADLEKQKRSE
jgi:hypothetical protein